MEYSQNIINTFFEEINELVSNFEINVNNLQASPDDINIINKIYRNVHSIKGEAALMQFNNFSTLAHKAEDMFSLIRDNKLTVTSDVIDILDSIISAFYEILKIVKNNKTDEYDISVLVSKINAICDFSESEKIYTGEKSAEEAEVAEDEIIDEFSQSGYNLLYRIEIFVADIPMKYARAFLVYNNLTGSGDILYSTVDFLSEQDDNKYSHFILYLATDEEEKAIYDLVDVGDIKKVSVKLIKDKKTSGKNETETEKIISTSIRVDTKKIDKLMDNVGEVIISYNKLQKFKENISHRLNKHEYIEFNDLLDKIKLIIDSMQDNVMNVRMIPIKTLFNKLPRLVNEIAKTLDKNVSISFSGGDTEIDKTVIDELKEPLLHIIRNSIDHGIEPPAERVAMGKPEQGKVSISAHQSGNNIIINVEDDGRGLDIAKIRKKIIEKDLLAESEALKLPANQLLKYIFSPGFSTKDNVSEISGRGVGMDVVKSSIESLRGSIKLSSKRNFGTNISIILPLTIAITNSLIVYSKGFYFAVPLYFIIETVRVMESEIEYLDNSLFLHIGEEVIPLVYLDKILNLSAYKLDIENYEDKKNKIFIVLVRFKNKKVGLIIDKLIGEQYIVIKPLKNIVDNFKGLAGATVLGDGNIAYIIDPTNLLS